jgi:hypothetical protein
MGNVESSNAPANFQFPYPWAQPAYKQSVTSIDETTLTAVMTTVLENRPQQDREIRSLHAVLVNPNQQQSFPLAHNVLWISTDSATAPPLDGSSRPRSIHRDCCLLFLERRWDQMETPRGDEYGWTTADSSLHHHQNLTLTSMRIMTLTNETRSHEPDRAVTPGPRGGSRPRSVGLKSALYANSVY